MDYDEAAEFWIKKDRDSVKMEKDALKEKITAFLNSHNTCALATSCAEFVRCTPIEYIFCDGKFYLFSEGGLKFKALKENKNVALSVFEPFSGFNNLKSVQVTGKAEIVEPFSDEYLKLLEIKKIPVEAMKNLPRAMPLIKITPSEFDYLDAELKKEGFSSRQHLC
ncbi:pyridoxamine 5'-phosphate oxidase family protein [Treponema zioleckii]|uniref:pyridoxamine 5'-phosphate oxidase family protein n=1 Tax=Treponema zioleckii TaxID=331680 RepID=UPI00168B2037|nr:pyridoxamine 5'-phosphate oxidase family protein [Treponema zioleckii]